VQGFVFDPVLARARQNPAEQETHAAADVAEEVPKECVPAAQGFAFAEPVPKGQ